MEGNRDGEKEEEGEKKPEMKEGGGKEKKPSQLNWTKSREKKILLNGGWRL